MGKKSFNKRRGGGGGTHGGDSGGSGGSGAGGPGLELMEVDPAPAAAAKIESKAFAKQRKLLPSTTRKVQTPSWELFIEAKRADDPEDALRALKIPDLRGIISSNDDPTLCAHCSVALPEGIPTGVGELHITCGSIVCDGCYDEHTRVCISSRSYDSFLLQVKAGAPWALLSFAIGYPHVHTESRLVLPSLKLAAAAGHPHANWVLAHEHAYDERFDGEKSPYLNDDDDVPRDLRLAAAHAQRAIVLDPRNYIGECEPILQRYFLSLCKDSSFKEAKVLRAQLVELGYDIVGDALCPIESITYGPFTFCDQRISAAIPERLPSVRSVDFLSQRDMSPEEIRLADYESGDGNLRMLFTILQFLSGELSGSSCPLQAGLAKFINSTLCLMSQSSNIDLYRSLPTLIRGVADDVAKVDLSSPTALLESKSFLLLVLTSFAALARVSDKDIQAGNIGREIRVTTEAIVQNMKLPNYLRALAMAIQADSFCMLPHRDERWYSSNTPKEVIIRRRARALSASVKIQSSCPLESLTSRLSHESGMRLALLEGKSRHCLLKLVSEIRSGSLDPRQRIASIADIRGTFSTVGGSRCDQCGKTLLEANMLNLLKCRRCCQTHFCSKECASLAWGSWHGMSCRKVGDFAVGDTVFVKGFSFDIGNGRIRCGTKAVITDGVENGDWAVRALHASDDGTYEMDVISSKNLYHMRSL